MRAAHRHRLPGARQFERAYDTNPLYARQIDGRGTTIVIVDSFGSPMIRHDLRVFDRANHLPAPPSLRIIAPAGAPPRFRSGDATMGGWATETSLDVEYAHAIAPGAGILLVVTPVAETAGVHGFPQMMRAERFVIDHHLGDVISQSFYAGEATFRGPGQIRALRYAFVAAAAQGVTVLACSGDNGPTALQRDGVTLFTHPVDSWPSTDPLVTSVGGTALHLNAAGDRTAPDSVWNESVSAHTAAASGGGTSAVFARPGYQDSVLATVGSARGTPDISLSAATDGGANVYSSFINRATHTRPGWYVIGGTSLATPMMAGIVALADQVARRPLGQIDPALYQIGDGPGSGITDITTGDTTVGFTNPGGAGYTVHGFAAVPGYDLATGLGTPDASALVYELANLAGGP